MNKKETLKRLSFLTIATFFVFAINQAALGQTLYDSFTDGDFTSNPVWTGTTTNWQVVANSDASSGATGSNTLRLNAPAGVAGTEYLSSQISSWGTSQEWGFFVGRRGQAFTAQNQQYFWLYANEANLNSPTVDGYRIAIGDDSGGDEIRLEYIVDGAVSATVITSTGSITNGLTDVGFLVRVTRNSLGAWELFTSTLPTVSGTGAIATDIPNSTNASISQGTGTNNSLVPANNGYIGVAALHSTAGSALTTAEFDQIYFTATPVTAANATISGRITTASGRGIRNVRVMLSGGNLTQPIYAQTSPFGFYRFEGISVGETYIVSVFSKSYYFSQTSRVITLQDNVTDADFVAEDRLWFGK